VEAWMRADEQGKNGEREQARERERERCTQRGSNDESSDESSRGSKAATWRTKRGNESGAKLA